MSIRLKSTSHHKSFIFGLVFLLAAFVLAACQPANTQPQATQAPETGEQPAETQAPAQPESRVGTFKVAMEPIVQTDPAFISTDSEVLVANHVYDYLVDIDPQNNIQPRLATDWSASDDGLTWTFQLAEGVTFHDGAPFGPGDVVWTYDRLRDPDLGSPTSNLYENIIAVEATGDLEVTFTLAQPNPFFLFDLSDNHALMIKNGVSDATDFNGTGPFILTEYSPEDRVLLEANPNYFIEGQPLLDNLEIIFFNDTTASVEALRGGQIDLVLRMSTPLFESLQGEENITTIDIPTNGFDLIRLRSDRPPGDDPRVIQALKLATDRNAIQQLVQQGFGAVGRDSPIGPLYTSFYTEETAIPERDPAAAAALLADAGFADGIALDLHVPDSGDRPDLAVVIKEQWAEAGIDVNVIVEPESVYYGENNWLEVDLGITGWGSRPYPQFYLNVMLVCEAIWNESAYCDEAFDELVNTAGTTTDEAERIAAYAEIQRILIEEGPVIVPYFFAQFGAVSDNFDGFEMKAFPGRSDFRAVSLSQ